MIKRLIILAVGTASLLASAFAQAVEPWQTGDVVPTVQLSGSTSGKGQVSAGLDFRTSSAGGTWDIFLNPSVTVANSSGIASILSVTSKDGATGPTQVFTSLSTTFAFANNEPLQVDAAETKEGSVATALCLARMGSPLALTDDKAFASAWLPMAAISLLSDKRPENDAARQDIVLAVSAKVAAGYPGCTVKAHPLRCACANEQCNNTHLTELAAGALGDATKDCLDDKNTTPVCAWLKDPERSTIDPGASLLCDAGKKYLSDSKVFKRKTHELRKLLYPQHLISFGVTYGAAAFKYLDGAGSAVLSNSSTRSSVAGNVLYTYVAFKPAERFTFELPLGFASTWTESTKTAYQCSPVGTLKGNTVETCEQTPMNEPTHGLQLSGAALFGLAAVAESDLWRAAIGPVFMVDLARDAKTTFQVGGEIPVYLSLTKSAGYEGDYEGMVRIMPTVVAEQTKDEKGVSTLGASFTLNVALLGKRKMFGSQLYWP